MLFILLHVSKVAYTTSASSSSSSLSASSSSLSASSLSASLSSSLSASSLSDFSQLHSELRWSVHCRCTRVKAWSSDGDDLCPWLLLSKRNQQDFEERVCSCESLTIHSGNIVEPAQHMSGCCCAVCGCKSVVPRASMLLPNPKHRIMRRVNLCSRHAPPEHMLGMVTSTRQFETIVSFYCNNKGSAHHHRQQQQRSKLMR